MTSNFAKIVLGTILFIPTLPVPAHADVMKSKNTINCPPNDTFCKVCAPQCFYVPQTDLMDVLSKHRSVSVNKEGVVNDLK